MNGPTAEENLPQGRTSDPGSNKGARPLRAWPALLLAVLMVAARFGPALTEEAATKYWMVSVFVPILCCLLLLIWWLVASRATWRGRLVAFLGLAAGAV